MFCLDPDPVSAPGYRILGKKECRKCSKNYERQQMKKATISYQKLSKNRCKIFKTEVSGSILEKIMDLDHVCPERLYPDSVNIRADPKPCYSYSLRNALIGP